MGAPEASSGEHVPDDEFVAVAADDELWDGEMEAYDVGAAEVLLVKLDGEYRAFDGTCPHQSVSLVEGSLDGATLTCRAHEWSFDVRSGAGVNPRTACLVRHAVRVRDGQVLVSRTPLPAAEPAH
ncbi:Rieske 2Fe-2S domain-containing protein [Kineosporia sp. A_224]|uniref:Rieske 2Fe-2S domain-containing protein n=1 Tax=Kineosporia sp. A_224 TaxID=1962180 RepID=UPI001E4E9BDC|nr:Rieske 2Fe-2S domain-containing protein [Kineosporia sp. A_224]